MNLEGRTQFLSYFVDQFLSNLEQRLLQEPHDAVSLCQYCHTAMKTPQMRHIRDQVAVAEDRGSKQTPLAEVRHFVGRLAYHIRCVRALIYIASRLPNLVIDPTFAIVPSPSALLRIPGRRNKTTLKKIAGRMVGNRSGLLGQLESRLQVLNDNHDIERHRQGRIRRQAFPISGTR